MYCVVVHLELGILLKAPLGNKTVNSKSKVIKALMFFYYFLLLFLPLFFIFSVFAFFVMPSSIHPSFFLLSLPHFISSFIPLSFPFYPSSRSTFSLSSPFLPSRTQRSKRICGRAPIFVHKHLCQNHSKYVDCTSSFDAITA